MKRVVIVDDDVELCELVTEYLKCEGPQNGDYAVVVLDVMLPGIGGFEVLRACAAARRRNLPS
jgi:two-component system response regulator CpxR